VKARGCDLPQRQAERRGEDAAIFVSSLASRSSPGILRYLGTFIIQHLMPSEQKKLPARKLALALILPLTGFVLFWFLFMRPMEERRHLRETGIKVPGMILDVQTTGVRMNKSDELELTVAYTRRDGVLDTGTTKMTPSRRTSVNYQPGVEVVVAYDSTNPGNFTIAEITTPIITPRPIAH
jgi:hypothetical protein